VNAAHASIDVARAAGRGADSSSVAPALSVIIGVPSCRRRYGPCVHLANAVHASIDTAVPIRKVVVGLGRQWGRAMGRGVGTSRPRSPSLLPLPNPPWVAAVSR
jgi:hypothetical protein